MASVSVIYYFYFLRTRDHEQTPSFLEGLQSADCYVSGSGVNALGLVLNQIESAAAPEQRGSHAWAGYCFLRLSCTSAPTPWTHQEEEKGAQSDWVTKVQDKEN